LKKEQRSRLKRRQVKLKLPRKQKQRNLKRKKKALRLSRKNSMILTYAGYGQLQEKRGPREPLDIYGLSRLVE